MVENLEQLSPNSRIWIYQSDRKLEEEEAKELLGASKQFLKTWAAHGQDLSAGVTIAHQQFLIIAVDESFTMASGCSIDSQFRFVQDLGRKFQIDFFNRSNLAFLKANEVLLIDMKEIKDKIAEGFISSEDTFFDNNVSTLAQLSERWKVKSNESWIKRYFTAPETV